MSSLVVLLSPTSLLATATVWSPSLPMATGELSDPPKESVADGQCRGL
jgi:hypothetical protein